MPESQRNVIALGLFEIAAAARAPRRTGAAGPIELLTELPRKPRVRHAESAIRAILENWDCVPVSARALIGGLARERWIAAARQVVNHGDPVCRINVARFAHDTADPGMAAVLCQLLSDQDPSVRLGADRALMRLVMALLGHVPEAALGEEYAAIAARPRIPLPADAAVIELERVELCRRVADAAWSFPDHRCRSPLIGSLLLLDRLPGSVLERSVADRIRRLLKETHHPSHAPIRSVLRSTPIPLLRERALRWIVLDGIATVCVDRLASADSVLEHEMVLSGAHLCLRRGRALKLRKVRTRSGDPAGALPPCDRMAGLSREARLGSVRLACLLGIEQGDRRLLLEHTLAADEPAIRLAGAHAAHPVDLPDFTFDPDPSVARSAATRWSTIGIMPPRVGSTLWEKRRAHAALLARSPNPEVRSIAATETARLDPFSGTAAARVIARRLYERDGAAFARLVRARFHEDEGVMAALELIRALALNVRFEMDLSTLATTHTDDRIRATAVALLGACGTEQAERVIRASLNAPDARVRSNAVESIPAVVGTLLEFKSDESHRVRATAVRRVLSLDGLPIDAVLEAGETLSEMLTDPRADHRLAGAWAAERTLRPSRRDAFGPTYRTAARAVSDAVRHDPDSRVRQRAARCARWLGQDEAPAQGVA
ncbi:MAG: hypothetical protein AAGA55_07270 [Planctomycetota bacterium]